MPEYQPEEIINICKAFKSSLLNYCNVVNQQLGHIKFLRQLDYPPDRIKDAFQDLEKSYIPFQMIICGWDCSRLWKKWGEIPTFNNIRCLSDLFNFVDSEKYRPADAKSKHWVHDGMSGYSADIDAIQGYAFKQNQPIIIPDVSADGGSLDLVDINTSNGCLLEEKVGKVRSSTYMDSVTKGDNKVSNVDPIARRKSNNRHGNSKRSKKKARIPTDEEIGVYRLWKQGKSQTEVATLYKIRTGMNWTQQKVSKKAKVVQKFLNAGGELPPVVDEESFEKKTNPKSYPTDPHTLEKNTPA